MNLASVLVAICTYNPNESLLQEVMASVNCRDENVRILIVDSGSTNGVPYFLANKFDVLYLQVSEKGIAKARFAAMKYLDDRELLIFVDDDNILGEKFVSNALSIANSFPNLGAFAGKLLLPDDYFVPKRFKPFLPYLAIRDLGDSPITKRSTFYWNEIEPPGAGMCLRPEVAEFLIGAVDAGDTRFFLVGAIGRKQLRGEDSYIARQCAYLNLDWGYHQDLFLIHRFDPNRLSILYLAKLLFNMGYSDAFLANGFPEKAAYPQPTELTQLIKDIIYVSKKSGISFVLGFRFLGQYLGQKRLKKLKQV